MKVEFHKSSVTDLRGVTNTVGKVVVAKENDLEFDTLMFIFDKLCSKYHGGMLFNIEISTKRGTRLNPRPDHTSNRNMELENAGFDSIEVTLHKCSSGDGQISLLSDLHQLIGTIVVTIDII